ncbi:energy-coupling factor transporter transmembrane component T family protein [Salinarimonas ramus]|uniref:Cobalt ABC transporter n=1 Tax=Salinarimonas ramus TaxID=690164 RepID=A0A917V1Q8_9HYPH|nr:energy-coupling factor transporter transmembrane protein EcfT [Salinarimonas ramus]GGK21671.1 cobalt ABC transporter [Salinarimonas ramus]
MTLSLYVPGESPLHRLTPGPKLAGLATAGLALVLVDEPAILAGFAALALALLLLSRVPVSQLRGQLTTTAILVALVVAASVWLDGWREAAAAGLRVAALVLLGIVVTATTRVSDLLETLERLLAPLDRIGLVRSADVALAIALVLRFVPEILAESRAIREARAARGMRVGPVALVVPLVVRTLVNADAIAAAIEARGGPRSPAEASHGLQESRKKAVPHEHP